jgi:hypothetical protein
MLDERPNELHDETNDSHLGKMLVERSGEIVGSIDIAPRK